MTISAIVKVINPAVSGTSQATGNNYVRQDIVLGWEETRPDGRPRTQTLKVTMHGPTVDRFGQLMPRAGETLVTGDLVFETRSYQGRIYNDVTLYL